MSETENSGNQFGEQTAANVSENQTGASGSAESANGASGSVEPASANGASGSAEAATAVEPAAEESASANAASGSAEAATTESASANAEQPANAAEPAAGESNLAAQINKGKSTTKKKGLSAAAQSVLDDRMKTFAELKAAYSATFGDEKKAPKAKSYEAFALHKIRKEQGEDAFQAKMKEYIERNQGKFASQAPKGKSKKAVKFNNTSQTAKNASPAAAASSASPASRASIMDSVRIMGSTAKGLIDSMISTMAAANTNPEKAAEQASAAIANNANKLNNAKAANSAKAATTKKPRKKRSNAGSSRKKKSKSASTNLANISV
jgi:hypothetical protein